MWYAVGGVSAVVALIVLYQWWDSRADRRIEEMLRTSERKRTEAEFENDELRTRLQDETTILLDKIDDLSHVIALQANHYEQLESLVMDAGGDQLAVARLRSELRPHVPTIEAAKADTEDILPH